MCRMQRPGMIYCEECSVERESRYTLLFVGTPNYADKTDNRDQVLVLELLRPSMVHTR